MYCSHFGFHRLPFNNTPDPTFYYSTPDNEEALATLQYAAQQRKGFVLVTGEIGAGKTLIGRIFIRQIEADASTAVINHTCLTGRQLLAAICSEFSLDVHPEANSLELVQRLQNYLLEQYAQDRFVVVLLDEAQNLPTESFEELRMLGNLEADDAKLLQVCILGQPELRERFRQSPMKQLDQRLFRRFHLPSLSRQQTGEYIVHRLEVAGLANPQIFTPAAVDQVYSVSRGIPRLINQFCDNALLTAYGQDVHTVDDGIINLVLERDMSIDAPSQEKDPPMSDTNEPDAEHTSKKSDNRIERIAGAKPEFTEDGASEPLIDSAESTRMAELAREQSKHLQERIDTHYAVYTAPASGAGELEKIAQRQNELQKIVGGATTRWLAAKEKLEAYRKEIQTEIGSLNERYKAIRENLDELTRSAAPAEDLDEIREMHLRETNRVLCEITKHREEFHQCIEQAENRWAEIRNQVMTLASEAATNDAVSELEAQFDRKLRDLLAQVEQSREQIFTLVKTMQSQCDRTQGSVEILRESYAQARAELAKDLNEKFQDVQSDLNEQLKEAARKDDVDALRHSLGRAHAELDERLDAKIAETRLAIDKRLEETAGKNDIDALRGACSQAHVELAEKHAELTVLLNAKLAETRRELDELLQCAARQEDVDAFRGSLGQAYEELSEQYAKLTEQLDAKIAAVQREIDEQISKAAGADDLAAIRNDYTSAIDRLKDQLGQDESEILSLRRTQHEQNEDILNRIAMNRDAMREMIESVVSRCRSTEEQLDSLSSSTPGEIAELRAVQKENVSLLMQHLDDHTRQINELSERLASRWKQTQEEIETLSTTVADANELDQVRRQQLQDTENILNTLKSQRNDLESLVDGVNRRHEEMRARIDALPQDIASAEQLTAIREEYTRKIQEIFAEIADRKAGFERAVQGVVERCEQTHAAVEELSARAASMQDLEELRKQQAQNLRDILHRIDHASSERQQEVNELNRRWKALEESVETLAATTTCASAVEQIQASLSRDVEALDQKFNEVSDKYGQHLRVMVDKIQETSGRLDKLEFAERPKPVEIKLEPQAAAQLAEAVTEAQAEREQLHKALENAEALAAHLRNCGSQVQELINHWSNNANQVKQESDQLRASAKMAADILRAMQRCHTQIDAKLKSERWQGELNRGENLTARLEQAANAGRIIYQQLNAAMDDFEQCKQYADDWTQKREQAQQMTDRLSGLIGQADSTACKFNRTLEHRKQLLAAIAKNTSGLVEVIKSAQRDDQILRPKQTPIRAEDSDSPDGPVSKINWPTFRTQKIRAS